MTKRKKEKRTSVRERLEEARRKSEAPDIDYDEVTDVYNLVLEQARESAENCQKQIASTTKDLKKIRLPKPGPTEKLG